MIALVIVISEIPPPWETDQGGVDSIAPRSSQRIPDQLVEIELAAEPWGPVTGFVLTLVKGCCYSALVAYVGPCHWHSVDCVCDFPGRRLACLQGAAQQRPG